MNMLDLAKITAASQSLVYGNEVVSLQCCSIWLLRAVFNHCKQAVIQKPNCNLLDVDDAACWSNADWLTSGPEQRIEGHAQFTRKNAVRKVQIAAAVDIVALTLIFTSSMHLFSSGYPFKGCSGAGVDAEHNVGYTLDGLQICFRTYTYNRPDLWMVRITSKPNTEHVSRLWGKQTQHRKASNWTLNPGPSHHCPGFTLYVVVRLLFFHRQVYPLVTLPHVHIKFLLSPSRKLLTSVSA